jgi:hypothetical protein
MKYYFILLIIYIAGCQVKEEQVEVKTENWAKHRAEINATDTLTHGKSYLSVYSQIYGFTENQKNSVTATVSMRNVSEADTVYILNAVFYNTEGTKIRSYFEFPISIVPMETIQIIIPHEDNEGGTGSNFLFEWKTPADCPEPLFEGVMCSMQGTQGFSFATQAVRTK